jgi:hypothetical protein
MMRACPDRTGPSVAVSEKLAAEPLLLLTPTLTTQDHVAARMVHDADTGSADLPAGSIGVLADYLAVQLGEMLAPTLPEVREAQAKALEKVRAEMPDQIVDTARIVMPST